MIARKGLLFDSHAHYDDEKFDCDREVLINSLAENGVGYVVDVGCSLTSIPKAMEIAEKYDFVYFTAGFHPCNTLEAENNGENESLDYLRSVLSHPKCIAVGEFGLDYYWDDSPAEVQKKWFKLQLDLALELGKPVVIHDRDAHGDTMDILREYKGIRGIMHCFSGSAEMAKELVKWGWYISFAGPITFKNAVAPSEVARVVPLDRMLIETDSPYLTPHPKRGKRNNSALMRYTAEKLAEVKGISYEELVKLTEENAIRIYFNE